MPFAERQLYKPTEAEIAEFLHLAKKRNKTFKTQDPFVPRDPHKAAIVDTLAPFLPHLQDYQKYSSEKWKSLKYMINICKKHLSYKVFKLFQ